MSNSKAEKEKLQLIQEKSQQILSELLKDEDNKYCVDCDAKGPRWASWNIGVFLCIRCAGIHRNMGVHISRVKSVNLDSWSPEQVGHMQLMGNSKARAVYEANLPDNFKRPNDSGLEQFVRAKYESKKYIAKEWVQPPAPKPAFDIEEERKKEKEKKRSKIVKGQTNSAIIETNPVPRPHSSPASGAINAEKVLNKNGSKPSTDLLGLSSSNATPSIKSNTSSVTDDDQFDAFVSCAPVSTAAVAKPDDLVNITPATKTNEEEDFFNQKAPEQKKLDKESILKLYETSSNLNQPQTNLFNLNSTTLTPLQPAINGFNTNLIANGTQPLNPMQPIQQLNNQASNLFATTASTQVINNGFANFNNQPANLNQQPFLAFNQNANTNLVNPLQANQQSTNPFLNASTNGTPTTLTSTDLFSSINANLSTTSKLETQLNGLNLNNNSTANGISVGQCLFPANFDTNLDKKVNGNGLNPVSITKVSPANPFLNGSVQPTQQVQPPVQTTPNLDILSSFSTTNNLNGLSKTTNDLDDLENWSSFHTATTANNATLTADTLWQ